MTSRLAAVFCWSGVSSFLLQLEKHDKGEIRVTELRPLEEMKEEAESYRSVIRGFDV